jgi:hypothetical protein
MDWSKLDIGSAATLRKEVDFAVRSLEEAVNNGQKTRTDTLVPAIREHIEKINKFQLFHHDDERSVLFDKEQGRLKAVLSENGISLQPTAGVQGSPTSARTPSKIPKRTGSATKSGSKPLYAWELAKKEDAPRHPINTEFGTFVPSHTKGIYNLMDSPSIPESARYIDYHVVLTQDELMTIVSRQRAVRQEAAHRQRFTTKVKENRLGIMATGPYVDSKRILKDHYRHDEPSKFTVKGGFRPAGKVDFSK